MVGVAVVDPALIGVATAAVVAVSAMVAKGVFVALAAVVAVVVGRIGARVGATAATCIAATCIVAVSHRVCGEANADGSEVNIERDICDADDMRIV